MSKRDILEIACIILGLFALIRAIDYIGAGFALAFYNGSFEGLRDIVLTNVVSGSIAVCLGAALIFGRNRIARLVLSGGQDDSSTTIHGVPPALGELAFWLRVAGIFFLIQPMSWVIAGLVSILYRTDEPVFNIINQSVMQNIWTAALALLIIWKSEAIADFIESKSARKGRRDQSDEIGQDH